MKTKVLLFNLPPSGGNLFPISLGYIAASLKRNNIETAIAEIDTVTPKTGQSVVDFVLKFKPRIAGFSVYQANISLAVSLAKLIKKIDPGILTVIGGPQATFMPAEALLQMPDVDVIARGEGEVIMDELAGCLASRRDLSGIKNITFRCPTSFVTTPRGPFVRNLDDLASPYKYQAFDLTQKKAAAMLTSRGCSFNCSFCYTPKAFHRTIRAHSPERVLSDMKICVNGGINRFFFADPSFTFDKKRVRGIMNGIIKRGWKPEIWCETRTDLVDAGLIELMAKAGVNRIAYGLESVDSRVNSAINKRLDIRQFENIVKVTRDAGIKVEVFTLYGLPGQTFDSCIRTIKFLKRLGINLTGNSAGQQLELFFGTDITDNPAKYAISVSRVTRKLYLSPGQDFQTRYLNRRDIKAVARHYKAQSGTETAKTKEEAGIRLF